MRFLHLDLGYLNLLCGNECLSNFQGELLDLLNRYLEEELGSDDGKMLSAVGWQESVSKSVAATDDSMANTECNGR